VVTVLAIACAALLGVGLLAAAVRNRAKNRDRVIAATIVTMPLLMPFYFDYDLMLLAVPAVLLASEIMGRSVNPFSRLACEPRPDAPLAGGALGHCSQASRLNGGDRWGVRAWVALYAWMLINPGLAARTHVNLTVPLLTLVAVLSISRCLRPRAGAQRNHEHAGDTDERGAAARLQPPSRLASAA
jgi:hypothetical protein